MFCCFFMARGWRPPHSWQGRCRPFPPLRPRTSSRPTSSSTCKNKRRVSFSKWGWSQRVLMIYGGPGFLAVSSLVLYKSCNTLWLEPFFYFSYIHVPCSYVHCTCQIFGCRRNGLLGSLVLWIWSRQIWFEEKSSHPRVSLSKDRKENLIGKGKTRHK